MTSKRARLSASAFTPAAFRWSVINIAMRASTSANMTAAPDASKGTSGVLVRAYWRIIASGAMRAATPRLASRGHPTVRPSAFDG